MDSIKTTDINETQGLPIVEPTSFLGYKFNVDVTTEQALELAKLDYEIGFEQSGKIPSFIDLFVEDNGNKKYFHSTRNSYKVVQNRDLAKQIDDLTTQFPNAKWSTMGKVHEVNGIGTTVFMTKRVKELDILVDGDRTETYIFGQTSHNSRTAFSLGIMFNRIFCSNQLPSVMANGNLVNRKHTDKIFDNLRVSKKVFELGLQNSQIMNKVGNDLALKKATIDDVWKIFELNRPMPEIKFDKGIETPRSKGAVKQWENTRDLIHDVWNGKTNRGNTMQNLDNNGWKVLQTFIEVSDKFGGHGDTKQKLTSELFNNDRQQKRQDWLDATLNHFELKKEDYVVS